MMYPGKKYKCEAQHQGEAALGQQPLKNKQFPSQCLVTTFNLNRHAAYQKSSHIPVCYRTAANIFYSGCDRSSNEKVYSKVPVARSPFPAISGAGDHGQAAVQYAVCPWCRQSRTNRLAVLH